MINAGFKFDKRFTKRVQARYERFQIKAGILEDGPHFKALPAKKGKATVFGGPARQKSRVRDGNLSDVGESIRKVHRVPYLTAPFKKNSRELKNVRRELANLLTGKSSSYSKIETALRSLIREPILKQRYGRNSRLWARVKTFNRFLIDTGQFFRAIIAKVRVGRVQK